jgi:geranylgeranyl diphosphate synthase type I
MIDVQMMAGLSTSKQMIEKKNMYKTASYTFTRPMLTGALLAGIDDTQLHYIKEL